MYVRLVRLIVICDARVRCTYQTHVYAFGIRLIVICDASRRRPEWLVASGAVAPAACAYCAWGLGAAWAVGWRPRPVNDSCAARHLRFVFCVFLTLDALCAWRSWVHIATISRACGAPCTTMHFPHMTYSTRPAGTRTRAQRTIITNLVRPATRSSHKKGLRCPRHYSGGSPTWARRIPASASCAPP